MVSYVPLLSCHKIYTHDDQSMCLRRYVFNKYLLSTWLDSCGCAESVTPILNNKLLLWLWCCRCHCLNSSYILTRLPLYSNHKQPVSLLYYHFEYAYARYHRKKFMCAFVQTKTQVLLIYIN